MLGRANISKPVAWLRKVLVRLLLKESQNAMHDTRQREMQPCVFGPSADASAMQAMLSPGACNSGPAHLGLQSHMLHHEPFPRRTPTAVQPARTPVEDREPGMAADRSRSHDPAGSARRYKCYQSSADGRFPKHRIERCGRGPEGSSGEKCPICIPVSGASKTGAACRVAHEGFCRGAQTMAILSGIISWYPAWVCRSRELMKHVWVG